MDPGIRLNEGNGITQGFPNKRMIVDDQEAGHPYGPVGEEALTGISLRSFHLTVLAKRACRPWPVATRLRAELIGGRLNRHQVRIHVFELAVIEDLFP